MRVTSSWSVPVLLPTWFHELAHAVLPTRSNPPRWLREGLSELLALIAETVSGPPTVDHSAHFSERIIAVQLAIVEEKLIPLEALTGDAFERGSPRRSLEYGESFSLFYFLNRTQHDKLWTLIREIASARSSIDVNRRFVETFGPLPDVERAWLEDVKRVHVLPWIGVGMDLRVEGKDVFVLEAPKGRWGVALNFEADDVKARTAVEATIQMRQGGAKDFDVIGHCNDEPIGVRFERSGATTLWRSEPAQIAVRGEKRSSLFEIQKPHDVAVHWGEERVTAFVDGETALDALKPCAVGSPIGIGTFDGAIEFRDFRWKSIE